MKVVTVHDVNTFSKTSCWPVVEVRRSEMGSVIAPMAGYVQYPHVVVCSFCHVLNNPLSFNSIVDVGRVLLTVTANQ